MKNTDKTELVMAAQVAGDTGDRAFWDDVQERLDRMEEGEAELVKPRAAREKD